MRAPEGTSLAADRADRRAHRARDPRRCPRSSRTLVTIGDDAQRTRQPRPASTCSSSTRASARRRQDELMERVRARDRSPSRTGAAHRRVAGRALFAGGSRSAQIQYTLERPRPRRSSQRYTRPGGRSACKKVPGAVDVDSILIVGKPELGVTIDRERAADLGVQVADVADALQLLVGGAQGLDLRGRRRGVRRPRARRARVPRRRRRPGVAHRAVDAGSARCRCRDVVKLRAGDGPVADQPPQPPAPGHVHGQRRARRRRERRRRRASKRIIADLHLPRRVPSRRRRAAPRRWPRPARAS